MKLKPYTLFLEINYPSGNKGWYGWKSYATIDGAIQAFISLRKNCSVFDEIDLGNIVKIVGVDGGVTFYEDS